MTKLSVNINKVATLRNTREIGIPSVIRAARICLEAGAHGITVHPRPDQRHIRPQDVRDIAGVVKKHRGAEFNIEGNPFQNYLDFARELKPTQCTLVPDEENQSTSDHGWDLHRDAARLAPIIDQLHEFGVTRVSLFMDPIVDAMQIAKEIGADRVELYTAPYAEAFARDERRAADVAQRYADAARAAAEVGLGVNAGHDLNTDNLPLLLEYCPQIAEVSIGHALIADALEHGLAKTVQNYLSAIERYPMDT